MSLTLREKFNEATKEAMKSKDQDRLSTLRLIQAALKDKDIAARTETNREGIKDDAILSMLQNMIKQRRESVAMYEQAGRAELAAKENGEIKVIEEFLPQQMSDAEVKAAIAAIIQSTGATSIKDMGKVMGELKNKYAGQMDFGSASNKIKEALSGA
jgi:uncharacterized protein YqeY